MSNCAENRPEFMLHGDLVEEVKRLREALELAEKLKNEALRQAEIESEASVSALERITTLERVVQNTLDEVRLPHDDGAPCVCCENVVTSLQEATRGVSPGPRVNLVIQEALEHLELAKDRCEGISDNDIVIERAHDDIEIAISILKSLI